MAEIDLNNFRVVKFYDADIERNYINDILHAIVARIDSTIVERGTVSSVRGDDVTTSVDSTDPSSPVVSAQLALQAAQEYADTHGVQTVVAGTNITVDNTDPLNPIINASGGGSSDHYPGCVFSNGNLSLTGTLTSEIVVPYGGTITEWYILGDTAGDVDITVSHSTFAAYPTMSTLFTASCSGAVKASDTGLSHVLTAGDTLRFSASSFSLFTRVSIVLVVEP